MAGQKEPNTLTFVTNYIQQKNHNRVLTLEQVPTSEQWADFLSKPVGRTLFKQAMVKSFPCLVNTGCIPLSNKNFSLDIVLFIKPAT